MAGPPLRTDIVEVYVFRSDPRAADAVEFLQLHRSRGALAGTWQPVMGHARPGETAPGTAWRELAEETGYGPARAVRGAWQLEVVNTYYLASADAVIASPGFAVEVAPGVEPRLNAEHDAARWVAAAGADAAFLWPGQRVAVAHILRDIVPAAAPLRGLLRLALTEN